MSDEYGGDFIVLTDEEGVEFELEHLDTMEYEGKTYLAFVAADEPEDAEEQDIIILVAEEEDGDGGEFLSTVDDEDELNAVFDLFMRRMEEFSESGEEDLL